MARDRVCSTGTRGAVQRKRYDATVCATQNLCVILHRVKCYGVCVLVAIPATCAFFFVRVCVFCCSIHDRNSMPDRSSAPLWYTSSTSSVYNKTQSAWPESWTGLCIEMRSIRCWCFWNMLPDNSVLSHSFRQAGWEVAWPLDANLNPDFNLQNPLFFAVGCGFTAGRESSSTEFASLRCCNPGQVGAIATTSEGLLNLDTNATTATSVWAQTEVQCLLRDAHRIVRSACLDGAPWSQNNEIVSNHCSILSLEGICSHKFHSEMSPSVNFWTFVASSFWQRFSYNFAGV